MNRTEEEKCLDIFLEFEDKMNLFQNFSHGNINYWHYIRFNIYMLLLEFKFGKINYNGERINHMDKQVAKKTLDTLILKNPMFVTRKDILVINHPRRVKKGAYYKCIYTDEWIKDLDSYYVFESTYQGKHSCPVKTKHLKYVDWEDILDNQDNVDIKELKEKLLEVIQKLEQICEIKIPANNIRKTINYLNYIANSRDSIKCWWKKILNRVKPKVVVMVVAYNYYNMLLVETAKENHIPVVELEHGIIGRGHISYNFLSQHNLKSFPDYIFTFGDYDKIIPRYPVNRKKIYAVGSPELDKMKNYYEKKIEKRTKKKKIITYISSNYVDLVEDAWKLSQEIDIEKYILRVKLHPSEYHIWRRIYPFLVNSNVEVVDDSKHDIYYYLATSDYIVGVASTAMYEATVFNAEIMILKVGEYFRAEPIIEYGMGIFVDSFKDILEVVNQKRKQNIHNKNNSFFAKNSKENLLNSLNQVIKLGNCKED